MFFNKKFTFYVLSNELHPDDVLTITTTIKEAKEYYHLYLRDKHMHTFELYCNDIGLDPKNIESWYQYYKNKVSSAEQNTYKFVKMTFGYKELASFLRALSNTPLIGCSYETDFDRHLRK